MREAVVLNEDESTGGNGSICNPQSRTTTAIRSYGASVRGWPVVEFGVPRYERQPSSRRCAGSRRDLASRHYSIVLADRSTGVVRRFTISVKPTLAVVAFLFLKERATRSRLLAIALFIPGIVLVAF